MIMLIGQPYNEVLASLKSFWIAPPLTAFIVVSIYHMRIGMRVIIDDYVHGEHLKTLALTLNWCFCWALAQACVFAMLRIFAM
jgi:succinate dehydrogenase / fumarate reductase membrane anchor subunit